VGGKHFLIDTSTDLRQQALRYKIPRVDAVLYTHPHADHVFGIDELRTYNFQQRKPIPVYGNQWTQSTLHQQFGYIFNPGKVEGGGIPRLKFKLIKKTQSKVQVQGVTFKVLRVDHGSMECLGYRSGDWAYITDCSHIPRSTLNAMKGLKALFLDCLRFSDHPTHFNLSKALEVINKVRPKKAYLIHLNHDIEVSRHSKLLPKNVQFAYDGLRVTIT